MTQENPPWFDFAKKAFWAAQQCDLDAACGFVCQAQKENGPDVLYGIMLSWIDTTIAAVFRSPRPLNADTVTSFTFVNNETGQKDTVETVPSRVAWVGRVINARLMDDPETFMALMDAAQQKDEQFWGEHVMELLVCCAATTSRGRQDGKGHLLS